MKENEEWRDIVGWEGLYQVSSQGRVCGLERMVYSKSNKSYSRLKGGIIKPDFKNKDYAQLALCRNGKYTKYLVHRLVAKAFIPNPDNLPEVNHKNTDKRDNRKDNLEWTTRLGNARHAQINGRYSNAIRGSMVARSKLNESQVSEIRRPRGLKKTPKNRLNIQMVKVMDKSKNLQALKKELQEVFNHFIRVRDTKHDKGVAYFICISCSEPKDLSQMNAGHFWPVGGHEAVRYDEDNVHGQCIKCNCFESNGVVTRRYEVSLIKKIGLARVKALELRRHNRSKMMAFEVELLIQKYKDKIKQLKR